MPEAVPFNPRGGFDMNQHVSDPIQPFAQPDSRLSSDIVRFPDCQVRVHLQMEVDMVLKPGLPCETLFDTQHTGHVECDLADLFHSFAIRHGVHKVK